MPRQSVRHVPGTFSIAVRDVESGVYGAAVTTGTVAVGATCPYVSEGAAVVTQSYTRTEHGRDGVARAASGERLDDALSDLLDADDRAPYRQVHGVGRDSEFAFTGAECVEWCGARVGDQYTVAGNMLAGGGVVDAVAEAYETGDGDVADRLDLSKSVVYTYLNSLCEETYVVKEDGEYRLSLQFLLVGEYVRNENTLYRIAKPEIEALAEETGEFAHLATEQHGLGVNLYKVSGEKAVGSDYQVSKLQRADYLHFSATGKSILAHLPRERVDRIVDRYGLPRKTEETITDRDRLFEELEATRERGYSLNDEEEIKGLQAVGAPVRNRHGRVLGSISVSGPVRRMKEPEYHDRLVESVVNAANVIEVNVNMEQSDDEFPTFS